MTRGRGGRGEIQGDFLWDLSTPSGLIEGGFGVRVAVYYTEEFGWWGGWEIILSCRV